MKKQLSFHKSNEASFAAKNPDYKPIFMNERILFDEDQALADSMSKLREGVIFKNGLNSKVKLENFTSEFRINGVSLFDDGRNSLVSSAMYN